MPSEQVEIKVRPAGAISPWVHLAEGDVAAQSTNTSQQQQLDATAPEFYLEGAVGGSAQEEGIPRMMVTLTLKTCVASVMQKQDIPALDLACTATRKQQQAPGQVEAPGTWQGGSSNGHAQTQVTGRERQQRVANQDWECQERDCPGADYTLRGIDRGCTWRPCWVGTCPISTLDTA